MSMRCVRTSTAIFELSSCIIMVNEGNKGIWQEIQLLLCAFIATSPALHAIFGEVWHPIHFSLKDLVFPLSFLRGL